MKNLFKIIMLIGCAALTGCASMNESECLSADWRTVGFGDGVVGRSPGKIISYRKDCAEYGVQPDLDEYDKGHYQGSKIYCTTRSGFDVGKRGDVYKHSCPQDLEHKFLTAYEHGRILYNTAEQLQKLKDELQQKLKHIEENKRLIKVKRKELIADGLVKEQRAEIYNQLEHIRRLTKRLKIEYLELEEQVRIAEIEYDELNQEISSIYSPLGQDNSRYF